MKRIILATALNCLLLQGAGNVYLGLKRGWIQGLVAAPCMAVFITAMGNLSCPAELRLPLPNLSGWVWMLLAIWSGDAIWTLTDMVVVLVEERKRCRESSSQAQTQASERP